MEEPPGHEKKKPGDFAEVGWGLEAARIESFRVWAEVKSGETSYTILRFKGPLANRDARVLKVLLDPLNRRPVEIVILDLTEVTQIDSTPLATLLMFVKKREPLKYALACALVMKGSVVFEKMKILGLLPLFEVFGSVEEAEYYLCLTPEAHSSRRLERAQSAGNCREEASDPDQMKIRNALSVSKRYAASPESAGAPARGRSKLSIKARVKLITSSPRTAIVRLVGYIQEREAEYLSWLLRQVGHRGAHYLILDVSGISYANSPAFGALLSIARIWREAYGEPCVALAGANTSLVRTIMLLGVEKQFVIESTVQRARDALTVSAFPETPHAKRRPSRPMRRI